MNLLKTTLLETEKQKQRVRAQHLTKRVQLALSGDKLMVRYGGGFLEFLEFLRMKGFLSVE